MKFKNAGKAMKEIRETKGLTQKQLGKKLDMHIQAISNAERGVAFYPIAKLKKLKKVLKLQMSDLMLLGSSLQKDFMEESKTKYKELFP